MRHAVVVTPPNSATYCSVNFISHNPQNGGGEVKLKDIATMELINNHDVKIDAPSIEVVAAEATDAIEVVAAETIFDTVDESYVSQKPFSGSSDKSSPPTSSDESSPPAGPVMSQRSYKVTRTKGLQKTRRPLINKHNTKLTTAKKTTFGSSSVKRIEAPEAEEAREAEEDATKTTAPTDNTKPSIHKAIQNAGEREDVEDDEEESVAASLTTTAIEKIAENSGIPISNDAGLNGVNEETTEASSTVNVETSKAYGCNNDEMSIQLNELNESAFQIYNQTVNGLTTAYVRAGEDLSLIGLALTQTNAAKSLNELMQGYNNKEKDDEKEREGEGVEVLHI